MFIKWVWLILVMFVKYFVFLFRLFFRVCKLGINLVCKFVIVVMCIVVGKVLLDDWDMLMWLLGWMGFLLFNFFL